MLVNILIPFTEKVKLQYRHISGRGGSRGRVQGVRTPPPPEMTCGFVIQLVFCKKKICGLLEETSAPPPKKNPGSAPVW